MASQVRVGEDRVQRLESLVMQLLESCAGTSLAQLHLKPASDGWSVMMIMAHVAELLPYWAHQAHDVAFRIENDAPFGRTHDDPGRIAAVEIQAELTLEQVVPRIREALTEVEAALQGIPAGAWIRMGRHARRGEMTVTQIVDQFLVEHMEEHARQAEATMRAFDQPVEQAQ